MRKESKTRCPTVETSASLNREVQKQLPEKTITGEDYEEDYIHAHISLIGKFLQHAAGL